MLVSVCTVVPELKSTPRELDAIFVQLGNILPEMDHVKCALPDNSPQIWDQKVVIIVHVDLKSTKLEPIALFVCLDFTVAMEKTVKHVPSTPIPTVMEHVNVFTVPLDPKY